MYNSNPTILYLDDDSDNREVFQSAFRRLYGIITAESIDDALNKLRLTNVAVILSDYRLVKGTGLEFFKQASERHPNVPKILTSAYGDRDLVIKSLNEFGIFSYIQKPWDEDELKRTLHNAVKSYQLKVENDDLIDNLSKTVKRLTEANKEIESLKAELIRENIYLKSEIRFSRQTPEIIGQSRQIGKVLDQIKQIAALDTIVLITGETGTGKDLVARAIHESSARAKEAFVTLNCAALPGNLIESELFGFEKGSFTGAFVTKPGLFEIASNGTIFLDEIGEMPFEFQSKLLHVLQSGSFFKLGGTKPVVTNARVICATNRRLLESIRDGKFRSDLFYRINIFPIEVPPLRERKEDIPFLVEHFIEKYQRKLGIAIKDIPEHTVRSLINHHWPGNVRELEAMIERSVIVSESGVLEVDTANLQDFQPDAFSGALLSFKEMQRRYLLSVLQAANWKISGKGSAAEILELNHNTLRSTLVRLKIDPSKPPGGTNK